MPIVPPPRLNRRVIAVIQPSPHPNPRQGQSGRAWCSIGRQLARYELPLSRRTRGHAAIGDWASTVTTCGRICFNRRRVNLSQVFAGQQVGVRQVDEHLWLVTFMHYDLGYFDDETCRLEPLENPFGPTVLPMPPE